MKKILFLMIVLTFFACNTPSSSSNRFTCSKEKPNGTCKKGETCNEGVCEAEVEACSETALDGFCEGEQVCVKGVCKDKNENSCSKDKPDGSCDNGKTCLNGVCVENGNLCSSDNKIGKCIEGKSCLDGECKDNSELCSTTNKRGLCLKDKTCLNGTCRDNSELCSENNPAGLCIEDKICLNGTCVEKKCKNGDISKCYPGDQSQVGKGICQAGIKICENGIWGNCKNAITPKPETCDGIDNNCNGDIDDGVLNACGNCGEVPTEIANNHIDDDCDGLIDENNAGIENCDGRSHQPCYTGNPTTHGKGICHGGFRDCNCENGNDGQTCLNGLWGECVGQVLPQVEICGNDIDDDCDGYTDEFCNPTECVKSSENEVCDNNKDDDCNGLIDDGCEDEERKCEDGAVEICGNGLDDDCKNGVDDGCSCEAGATTSCFTGDPLLKRDLENTSCKSGTMNCVGGELWSECTGEVLPSIEVCDGIDNDCDGLIDNNPVDGNVCGKCTDNVPVEICGDGIDNDCDTFIDEDCPDNCVAEAEICDGIDNNCDGLIDEGVLNACGTCGDSCYVDTTTSDELDNGTYDGVDKDEDGNITLNTKRIENNFIWIADASGHALIKINTITGEKILTVKNIGRSPSRTAVTRDGGVWVATRSDHKVYKLSSEGVILPGFPVQLVNGCGPRGVAIDSKGNAWVGCYYADKQIYKISPAGQILITKKTESKTYGLAIDSKGILYNSARSSSKSLRIDTNKNENDPEFLTYFSNPNSSSYGIVVDHKDNVWLAIYKNNTNNMLKLTWNPATKKMDSVAYDTGAQGKGGRGIAVDSRGHIWTAFSGTTKTLCEYSASGEVIHCYQIGNTPVGVGIDSEEDVWVITYTAGAYELKFDPNNPNAVRTKLHYDQNALGTGTHTVYTYSDMTGYNLRNITAPSGKFTIIQDVVREDATFDSLKLDGDIPNGSKMKVRARVSNDKRSWSSWSETKNFVDKNSDIILNWGDTPTGRYIQIEVSLELGNEGAKPKFRSISVNWQRP